MNFQEMTDYAAREAAGPELADFMGGTLAAGSGFVMGFVALLAIGLIVGLVYLVFFAPR